MDAATGLMPRPSRAGGSARMWGESLVSSFDGVTGATMSRELRVRLLEFARTCVEREVRSTAGRATPLPVPPASSEIGTGGVFVTLRTKGRLRGCIGTFSIQDSLEATLRDIAVSATHDTRFLQHPLGTEELDEMSLEVSLLSEPVRTSNPASLEVGRDGVLIRRDGKTGCFLPQVATERGWDAETFLSQCCTLKAALPADAWQDPETDVYVFEAEVLDSPAPRRRPPARPS